MNIIISKRLGFCFGVKRSIEIAQETLKDGKKPVSFLGHIVHNENAVADFKEKGGTFVKSADEVEEGTLVTKAHGVSNDVVETAEKKGVEIKNTTCPIVREAQKKAEQLYLDGYQVVIIGEKEHPETQVINECAGGKAIITEDEEEIKKMYFYKKIGVVAQTTKKREKVEKVLEFLKKRCKELKWEDTICNEVSERQKELKGMLDKVNGVIVIGSKTSANTTRLAEITEKNNKKLWWVNSVEELDEDDLKNYESIGVVSGTSAPDWEVEKIINFLKEISYQYEEA